MPREMLDRQLRNIQDEVLLLGSMVEKAVLEAVDALKRGDIDIANQVYEDDTQINEKRFAIENAILISIASQQPVAHDLRVLTAMLEVITELERMGDYAKGIAKITMHLKDSEVPIPTHELTRMAELAVSMLHRALSAFIEENTNLASIIPRDDNDVDDLYKKVYKHTINAMIANPEYIDSGNYVLWAGHNLERMADRVVNICERTVFIVTGELLEIESSDDEDSE